MIRLLIINETPLFREMVAAALGKESDIAIMEHTAPGDGRVRTSACDVALLKAAQPDPETLDVIRSLTEGGDAARLLVVGTKKMEAAVLKYIEAGASGYVCEEDSFADLVENIRAAYNDEACVSRRIAATMMERIQELARQSAKLNQVYIYKHRYARLTAREREVLELIGRGYSNQDIGQELVVETGTVKNHVHSILKKLRVRNRHDAAAFLAVSPPAREMGGAVAD